MLFNEQFVHHLKYMIWNLLGSTPTFTEQKNQIKYFSNVYVFSPAGPNVAR